MATLKGLWVWNTSVNFNNAYSYMGTSYTSNGTAFNTISVEVSGSNTIIKYNTNSPASTTTVYEDGRWSLDAYRTIDFGTTEQEFPDEFYTEFIANAKSESSGGDTPTTPEPEEPDTPTETKTIKKGTYRWNDVLSTFPYNTLNFTLVGLCYGLQITSETSAIITQLPFSQMYCGEADTEDGLGALPMYEYQPSSDDTVLAAYYAERGGWDTIVNDFTSYGFSISGDASLLRECTVTEDTAFTDTDGIAFANWFEENTEPVSSGGETPDTPDTPDTDVTVDSIKAKIQNLINKANTTTGKSDTDLTSGVNSLIAGYGQGGSTECDGCIIEVDTLPTENIDETALYKVGESYYKYSLEFKDILVYISEYDVKMWLGTDAEYYTLSELPDEADYETVFKVSGEILYAYFIEKENDIYVYGDSENTGTNTLLTLEDALGTPFKGFIPDPETEVTEDGYYALCGKGYKEYISPSGKLTITENGTFDVLDKSSVDVNIPDSPLPIEISTKSEMNDLASTAEDGSVYKYTGESTVRYNPPFYEKDGLYVLRNGNFKKLVTDPIAYGNFLTFSSLEMFSLECVNVSGFVNKSWDGLLEYSTDGVNWYEWNASSIHSSVYGMLYLRGTGNTVISNGNGNHFRFSSGVEVSCSGNIETLLDYNTVANGEHPVMGEGCFSSLFEHCPYLTHAPDLPATLLTKNCYAYMFNGCDSLTHTPDLPATVLAESCYAHMFTWCGSLTHAPALPATVLADSCYYQMFYACPNLTTIPALPARGLLPRCYSGMFGRCTSVKMSTSKTDEYKTAYKMPVSGDGEIVTGDPFYNMFSDTGGTFTSTPSINTTYYTSNPVISLII